MKKNEKGFSAVGILFMIVIVGLISATGWIVYDRQKSSGDTKDNTQTSQSKTAQTTNNTQSEHSMNTDWRRYESSAQKISFEYPKDWYVTEDTASQRIYISSHQGEYNKGNIPEDYQSLWLSTAEQETTQANEDSTKAGTPKCCMADVVTAAVIASGEVKINTYEYKTVGGSKLEAYWTLASDRFYATNASEIGNQEAMVATLKKLLPTVRPL